MSLFLKIYIYIVQQNVHSKPRLYLNTCSQNSTCKNKAASRYRCDFKNNGEKKTLGKNHQTFPSSKIKNKLRTDEPHFWCKIKNKWASAKCYWFLYKKACIHKMSLNIDQKVILIFFVRNCMLWPLPTGLEARNEKSGLKVPSG